MFNCIYFDKLKSRPQFRAHIKESLNFHLDLYKCYGTVELLLGRLHIAVGALGKIAACRSDLTFRMAFSLDYRQLLFLSHSIHALLQAWLHAQIQDSLRGIEAYTVCCKGDLKFSLTAASTQAAACA